MAVESLTILPFDLFPRESFEKLPIATITSILLDVLDGVIDAERPVTSVKVVDVVVKSSVFAVLTTCNTAPAPKFVLAAPEASFADVTAPLAISSAVTHASGNPPAEMPVIVPVPLIEMGILNYRVC